MRPGVNLFGFEKEIAAFSIFFGWKWPGENADETNPVYQEADGSSTGLYSGGVSSKDEVLWAASELYLCNGDENLYNKIYEMVYDTELNLTGFSASRYGGYAALAFLFNDTDKKVDRQVIRLFSRRLLSAAQNIITEYNREEYESITSVGWYSSGEVCSDADILIYAMLYDHTLDYSDCLSGTLDYLLGKNAVGYSFITGIGDNPIRNVHIMINRVDGVDEPLPGYLSGGPTKLDSIAVTHKNIYDYIPSDTPRSNVMWMSSSFTGSTNPPPGSILPA